MSGFIDTVKKTIEKHQMLNCQDVVVVGVSGGPDSVALLYILNLLKEQYKLKLWVTHINHMFRGEDAKREAEFVARLAQEWDLPYEVFTKDVPAIIKSQGLSPQDAGHRIRKEIYNKVRERIGGDKLALGHHANDRAETVLLHLIQGTGVKGLASMPPKYGWVIRPLAQVSKQDIISFCQKENLPYCLDPSNNTEVYLRNKIRLKLLPFLEDEFNPQIMENLIKLEDIIYEENIYLDNLVENVVEGIIENKEERILIDLGKLREQSMAIQRRIIRKIYDKLKPQEQGLGYVHVEQIIELSKENEGEKKINLPKDILVKKSYNSLEFINLQKHSVKEEKKDFRLLWDIPGSIMLSSGKKINAYYSLEPPLGFKGFAKVVIDGAKLGKSLLIRNRISGDRMQPLGMSGSKKLKDIFIDLKIPREERDTIPLVCSGDDIVWIPNILLSEKYKISPETTNYLVLEVVEDEFV